MALSIIWTSMAGISIIFAVFLGRVKELGSSVLEGAGAAVQLCLTMAAAVCLWSGVLEVMRKAGISEKLSGLMRPVLKKLFPESQNDPEIMEAISGNVSANLLGLGNAATPLGIRATRLISAKSNSGTATDDLCMLVVLNTASIQLIPSTVAAVRSAAGASSPFEILPAVWLSSVASVTAGLIAVFIFRRRRRKGL